MDAVTDEFRADLRLAVASICSPSYRRSLFISQSSAIRELFLSCGIQVLGCPRLILLCKALHVPFITTEIGGPRASSR
jgi:hypothetical protein